MTSNRQRTAIVPAAVMASCHRIRVLPELFQHIALFLPSSLDMASFLTALPASLRTPALESLYQLHRAVAQSRLYFPKSDPTYPRRVHLWPNLVLPRYIAEAEIAVWIEKVMVLYPVVEVQHVAVPLPYPLLPTTKLAFDYPIYPHELELVLRHWKDRAISILLLISDNGQPHRGMTMDATIDVILRALQSLPALRQLELSWFGASMPLRFPRVLYAMTTSPITKVDFRDCHVEWDQAMVVTLAHWLTTKPLVALVLPKTSMHVGSLPLLRAALWASRTLRSLYVSQANVVLELLSAPFRLPPTLQSLTLKPCRYVDLPTLLAALDKSQLTTLQLGFAPAPPLTSTPAIATLLEVTLPGMARLTKLRLDRIPISPVGSNALAIILPRLVEIVLKDNVLLDMGVLVLVSALPRCKKLQKLRLSKQGCTDTSAMALARLLPLCPELRELDLSENCIQCPGAMALSAVIACLDDLCLSSNEVGPDGAVALVQAMARNAGTALMTWLLLDFNPLGEEGVLSVIDVVAASAHRFGHIDLRCTVEDPLEIATCEAAIEAMPYHEWCWWDA